jgi:hypothetical protein
MLWPTVEAHHGDQHMTTRTKKPEAASAAHALAHDEGESVTGIIADIVGDAGDDEVGMMGEAADSRKLSRQSPATRSAFARSP